MSRFPEGTEKGLLDPSFWKGWCLSKFLKGEQRYARQRKEKGVSLVGKYDQMQLTCAPVFLKHYHFCDCYFVLLDSL